MYLECISMQPYQIVYIRWSAWYCTS